LTVLQENTVLLPLAHNAKALEPHIKPPTTLRASGAPIRRHAHRRVCHIVNSMMADFAYIRRLQSAYMRGKNGLIAVQYRVYSAPVLHGG
jgi:hypothetical protein